MSTRTGVFVCHCGSNIAGKLDVNALRDFAATLPGVAVARDYKFMCSEPGQEQIRKDIVEHRLDRVVVAACSPRMHEPTFRRATAAGGLNEFFFQMANIREHVTWVTADKAMATEKAKALVAGAVRRVSLHKPLTRRSVPVNPDIMIIGGGIAGIHAALTAAAAGKKVYLVERSQSIGGHMAQFDKTFPTLDCSACILTPKMVSVSQHPKIELLNYSEVDEITGFVGNFTAKVRVKARGVDYDKCNGCGVCIEKCPKKVPSEFDEGLGKRKAIYVDFPQAVPNKPVIDREHCTYYEKGKCKICEKFCEPGAIAFEQQDEIREIQVGTIIMATGFDLYDVSDVRRLGYGRLDNVLSSLQFERMLNSAGPTGGEIKLKNGEEPKSIAIAHCIGSRDKKHREYCSRVCCMAGLKFAHLIKDRLHDCTVYNFYIDMRCFGKGYEEFYNRVQDEKVQFVRGKVAEITDRPFDDEEAGKLIVVAEDTMLNKVVRLPVDMVVLLTALVPRKNAEIVAQLLKCSRSADGFMLEKHPKLAPVHTSIEGVFIAGACQGPKDIPDVVAQAGAAASESLALIDAGHVELEPDTAYLEEELCSGCKTCIPLCPYEALSFDAEKKIAAINEALCKGCGTCVAACPSGALQQNLFEDKQIYEEIDGVLSHV